MLIVWSCFLVVLELLA
jgi:hypothetical protein